MGLKNSSDFSLDMANGLLSVVSSAANATTNFQGMNNYASGVIFVATADGTVGGTASETTIIGTGVGGATLPVNFLTSGKTLRIRCEGYIANTATPTIRFKIKFGSTIIVDTGAQTMTNITGTRRFCFESIITCRGTGTTGTVISQGELRYFTTAILMVGNDAVATSTTTVDTTLTQVVDATATWGTSSGSNTLTCTNAIIEVLV